MLGDLNMTKGSKACIAIIIMIMYISAFINVRLNVTINIREHIKYFIVLGVYICTCIKKYKVISISTEYCNARLQTYIYDEA